MQRIINYDDATRENIKKHDLNLLQILDHSYRKLIVGGSGSGKTNSLLNLIKQQDNDDYNIIEANYQYLIKK